MGVDQELSWWRHVVFDGWRDRPGPRYQRLSAALLDAVDSGRVGGGARLPPERLLADGLGVSRGTVVAALDQLVQTGVVRRRQGAGTFVVGRPGWLRPPADNPAAALLLRRLVTRETIDLSLSVPPGTDHLPSLDWGDLLAAGPDGPGLDPVGSGDLREQVAAHLTRHLALPTTAGQLVITAGAQQALSIVFAVAAGRPATVVTPCPTYPGTRSAAAGRRVRFVGVPADGPEGPDPEAVGRAARRADNAVVYAMAAGANPTGAVMPPSRRHQLLEAAAAAGALVVEDLALADLVYDGAPAPPLAALAPGVVAVGSASKLLWAGLRVGWIRADEPLRSLVVRMKAALDLATGIPAQRIAQRLLASVDDAWLGGLRAGLAQRRDHLTARLSQLLPAWEAGPLPAAGMSVWPRLPVAEAATFAHTAARYGVVVGPGDVMCVCGRHAAHVRLSFAHPIDLLDLAAERLAVAWEAHSRDLAATPRRP